MRSPKKKPFSALRKCSKFKITNWSKYNDILRNRGRVDFMIAENLSDGVSANIKCTRHLHEKCTKKKDTKLKV